MKSDVSTFIVIVFFVSLSGLRSSLGEYHKDSRNLKRLKDSSEFTCSVVDVSASSVTVI